MQFPLAALLVFSIACGGESESASPEPNAETETDESTEAAPEAEPTKGSLVERMVAAAARERRVSREGTMTFSIDGAAKSCTHFPEPENVVTTRSVSLVCHPELDSPERFSLVLTNFNLLEATLPMDIEGNVGEAVAAGRVPRIVMITYNSADAEFAGAAKVSLTSYDSGFLEGSISHVELNGAGESRGSRATLADVQFRIQAPTNAAGSIVSEAITPGAASTD